MSDLQPVPFRLHVLKQITNALEQITPDNGYVNDLSGKVFRGRDYFGETDPIPLISVLEAPQGEAGNSPEDAAKYKSYWNLLVQGFCENDRFNPTDPAYVLLADVQKCLAKARKQYLDGGLDNPDFCFGMGDRGVIAIEIESPVVRPSDELSSKAYFWMVLRVKIAENMDNPYKY